MIFFRLLLYIICLFSIGWSILFFGGPSLIKKLAVSYTGGAVELSNVSVSPMFDVEIGRLDFNIPNMNDGTTTSGFSRSTEIIWSLQNGRPFLTFDIGPTYVKKILSLENIKIHTPSFNKMDWQNLRLVGNVRDLVMHSLGEADKVYFDGNYSSTSNRIIDLSIDARVVNLKEVDQTLSVDVVTFAFDEFDLNSSLGDQYFSGRFTAKNIANENPVVRVQNGTGNINISPVTKNVSLNLLNMTFASLGGAINKVNLSADYDTGYALNNLSLSLANGTFGNRAPSFSNISVDMFRRNDNFSDFIFSGDLHEFEFYNEDNYVGLIPASNFNSRMEFDEKSSKLRGNSNIRFTSTDAVGISGSAEVGLIIENSKTLNDCVVSKCRISDAHFEYHIKLDDEWIKGRSECFSINCNLKDVKHELTTSNTANIFTALNKAKILNPLSSLYFYTAVTAGQKINSGHRLNF